MKGIIVYYSTGTKSGFIKAANNHKVYRFQDPKITVWKTGAGMPRQQVTFDPISELWLKHNEAENIMEATN